EIARRGILGHLAANGRGETLGRVPAHAIGFDTERRDDVKALATRRLAKGDEAEALDALAQLLGRGNDLAEGHIAARVEIEDQPTRPRRLIGGTVPRMEFDGGDLSQRNQRLDP